MNTECAKCLETLTHNEDALICNVCKNTVHFYCTGISETNFKKLSKLNKNKFVCCNCKITESSITKIQPSTKMETKIEELISSVEFMGKQFDVFNKKVDSMLSEIKILKIENEKISNENKYLSSEVSSLKLKIDNIEQFNLNKYIDITGIPQTTNENCSEIVKQIGLKTNTTINVIEAKRIHINNSKNSIIVAELETTEMKRTLIRNSKISKLSANNILSAWPNETKVYVNERLTKDRRILFGQARTTGKDKQFKFIWVNNGDILMKKDESSKTIRIRIQQDLEKV